MGRWRCFLRGNSCRPNRNVRKSLWEILPTSRDSLPQGLPMEDEMAGHSYTRSTRDLPTKMKFMLDSGAVIGAIYTYYY